MQKPKETESSLLNAIDWTSPSWQQATFDTSGDDVSDYCWLLVTFPIGVTSKLALVRSKAIAEAMITALLISQRVHKNFLTLKPDAHVEPEIVQQLPARRLRDGF